MRSASALTLSAPSSPASTSHVVTSPAVHGCSRTSVSAPAAPAQSAGASASCSCVLYCSLGVTKTASAESHALRTSAAPEVAALLAPVLGWDDARQEKEVAGYEAQPHLAAIL